MFIRTLDLVEFIYFSISNLRENLDPNKPMFPAIVDPLAPMIPTCWKNDTSDFIQ